MPQKIAQHRKTPRRGFGFELEAQAGHIFRHCALRLLIVGLYIEACAHVRYCVLVGPGASAVQGRLAPPALSSASAPRTRQGGGGGYSYCRLQAQKGDGRRRQAKANQRDQILTQQTTLNEHTRRTGTAPTAAAQPRTAHGFDGAYSISTHL